MPAKQVILTDTKNEVQLNAMLAEGLLDSDCYTNATPNYALTIAGISDVPVEIASGVKIDHHRDLYSTHEEADILITQHAISPHLGKSVRVMCDDTDVFVLLVHFY